MEELKKIENKINDILNSSKSNQWKRDELNKLEKKYPQSLFIKTHLCDKCNTMKIEVWTKPFEVQLE